MSTTTTEAGGVKLDFGGTSFEDKLAAMPAVAAASEPNQGVPTSPRCPRTRSNPSPLATSSANAPRACRPDAGEACAALRVGQV
jgi:hypothetical protein